MSVAIKRGTGIKVTENEEVFNIGKDWLVWDFKHSGGHWFANKREAMRFIKYVRDVKIGKEIDNETLRDRHTSI